MNKSTILPILLALITIAGQAKDVVWEQPTTEFGTSYGDGYFYLALDVTRVELKTDETVVYITARQRSDYPEYSFQFVGDTYLKAGERLRVGEQSSGMQRFALVSADGIELNKFVQTNKEGRRDMVFHFPPLPQGTRSFDFIEGDGQGAFQIKGIKPAEERWKQLFPSYWRDDKGDWKIAFFEDCILYDCKFWNYDQRNVNPKTGEELFTPYIASLDSLLKAQYANLDELCEQHPTLSTRFNRYRRGNTLMQQARAFGQARFHVKGIQLPDNARRYAYLNVQEYPTYKLFDRNGNLLNLPVDPHHLEDLARLLEQLK